MIAALPLLLGLLSPPGDRPEIECRYPCKDCPKRGKWSAGLGIRPELAAGGSGLGFQSMFRYRFAPNWSLDTAGRSVHSVAQDAGDPDQFYLALIIGLGWLEDVPPTEWTLRTSARFTHVHHATVDSWKDTPFANLAGDSDGGVEHRSGAELAVGAVAPMLTDLWGEGLRWEIELQGGVLPSSSHFEWTAGLTVGLLIDSIYTLRDPE
jgi:hypothetical protein